LSFVSVTRLRVASGRFLVPFALWTWRSMRQARRAEGFLGGHVGRAEDGSFWTLTAWTGPAAMRAFRNAGAHQKAMRRLPRWCDEAQYAHFEHDGGDVPGWDVAEVRLLAEPTFSRVLTPSPDHAAGRIRSPGVIRGAVMAARSAGAKPPTRP
jgi:heme-degrading monooxygenase HmoA